jgi:hypothetical protein
VDKQVTAIRRAFDALTATNDFVVVEGLKAASIRACTLLNTHIWQELDTWVLDRAWAYQTPKSLAF